MLFANSKRKEKLKTWDCCFLPSFQNLRPWLFFNDANLMKWLSRIKITSKVEDETGVSTFHHKQPETSNTSKVQISQYLILICLFLRALFLRRTSCHCPSSIDPTYASKANETDLSKSDQKFEDSYPPTKWFSRVQRNDKTTLPNAIKTKVQH